jgi:hypothetical protein
MALTNRIDKYLNGSLRVLVMQPEAGPAGRLIDDVSLSPSNSWRNGGRNLAIFPGSGTPVALSQSDRSTVVKQGSLDLFHRKKFRLGLLQPGQIKPQFKEDV